MIGPGFNRIKAHVISYTVKSLRKFGRISNSSTRDGEMNMKLLRASDRGTRQTHVHDHCVNVLITVEASELQESLEEPRPTKIRRRDTHQFQITSIFSQGGACEQWSKIHIDLSDGLHGPSIPPELTTEKLRSQTWEKVLCLGTRLCNLAKQVLDIFDKVILFSEP